MSNGKEDVGCLSCLGGCLVGTIKLVIALTMLAVVFVIPITLPIFIGGMVVFWFLNKGK